MVKIDLANFVTIGLMAFIFIWLVNRGIRMTPLAGWAA